MASSTTRMKFFTDKIACYVDEPLSRPTGNMESKTAETRWKKLAVRVCPCTRNGETMPHAMNSRGHTTNSPCVLPVQEKREISLVQFVEVSFAVRSSCVATRKTQCGSREQASMPDNAPIQSTQFVTQAPFAAHKKNRMRKESNVFGYQQAMVDRPEDNNGFKICAWWCDSWAPKLGLHGGALNCAETLSRNWATQSAHGRDRFRWRRRHPRSKQA